MCDSSKKISKLGNVENVTVCACAVQALLGREVKWQCIKIYVLLC